MSKRKSNLLLGDFEKVARAMAGRYDIKVVASNACATDGRTIYFPSNADDFDAHTLNQLSGYNDHEVGHIREEDRHALAGKETPITIISRLPTSKQKMFFNIFDDIRMERREAQEHVGVAENLRASADYCKKVIAKEAKRGKVDFWRGLGTGILAKAHGQKASWLTPAHKPYMDAIEEEIEECCDITKTVWGSDVENLVERVLIKLNETAEALEEEKERREEEKKRKEEEEKQEQEGEEEGSAGEGDEEGGEEGEEESEENGTGDEMEEGEGDGSGTGAGDEEGEEEDGEGAADSDGTDDGEDLGASDGEDGTSEPGTPDAGEGEENGSEDGADSDEGADTDDTTGSDGADASGKESKRNQNLDDEDDGGEFSDLSDEELEEAADLADEVAKDAATDDLMDELKDEINKKAKSAHERTGRYAATTQALKEDEWFAPHKDEAAYEAAKKTVAPQIKGMKSKLINLIRSQAEDTMVGDREEGDLDDDALHTVRTGNRRVYTQLVNGTPLDTAVSILIDQSGSMGGSRIKCAREMAVALGETFNALGVPFEIIGFENRYLKHGRSITQGEATNPSLRKKRYNFRTFKTFDESYRRVKARLGNCHAHGDNADGEAVLETAKRLIVRPESRKLLFVLSDGQPACAGTSRHVLANHLKEVIEKVTASGIEVIGIGCEYEGVKEYYNEEHGASHTVVYDVQKLAVKVYKIMKDQLLGKGRKRGRKGAAA